MARRDDGKSKEQKPKAKPQAVTKQPVDKAALRVKLQQALEQAFGHEDVGLRQFWGK
jgi:hypothetical protein